MHTQDEEKYITSNDFESITNNILLKETNSKETEERLKICKTLMQILVYSGIVQKVELDPEEYKDYYPKTKTKHNKGFIWVFEHTKVLTTDDYQLDEKDYFSTRREEFKIEFKKEPPKSAKHNFDVSV